MPMLRKSNHRIKSVDGLSPHPAYRNQAKDFPTVGMTLPQYTNYRSYSGQYAAPGGTAAAAPTLPAQTVKKSKAGRWARFKSKWTKKKVAILIIVLLLLPILWLGGKFIYNAARIFKGNIFGALSTTQLKGEDRGRVNILLAGNSVDDPGHQGASLTDSIMIVSIDTKDNRAFLMSVPRDLWVNIPGGYGYHKINTAYTYGQQEHFHEAGYPDGGMGLLEKVIEQNLGIDLNYNVLINYNALKQAVDAVGGVDVTIRSDDPRGLYDPNIARVDGGPLKLSNGKHHLDGQTALNFARARGDSYYSYGFPGSDFDRTAHQRQLLVALKAKAFSSGVIANPLKVSSLMDALGANVKTDMTLSEVRRLIQIGQNIDNKHIKSVSLNDADGKNLLASYRSPSGESALIPAAGIDDYTDIQRFIHKLTSNNPIVKEDATVTLLNGTDTYGLAAKNADKLEAKSINVAQTADAAGVRKNTTIINNAGTSKPATLQLLQSMYGSYVTTTNPYKGKYNQDFIVVLGTDQASTGSSSL
ncbi:MAG TPA: LCP family protein [Candidatus Saccharimonadales bacterium]|nr:LCP family protein [Candidatus Saccharimonadales bacterium]